MSEVAVTLTEKVVPTKGINFSATRLKTWMSCSLQAWYQYDVKPIKPRSAAAAFGSIVHVALQRYNDGAPFAECLDFFERAWADPAIVGESIDWWPRNTKYGTYREIGREALIKFDAQLKWDEREVIGTEVPFMVPIGEHFLTGYIDLLEVRKSGRGKNLLRIVDYKTAGRQPTKAELALDVQFTAYAWATQQREFWVGDGTPKFPGLPNGEALWERFSEMGHRGIWFHLRNQKELDVGDRDDEDFLRLYRVMNEVAKADAAGIYVPKIGEACGLCDYREECRLSIPESLAEDPDDPDAWL